MANAGRTTTFKLSFLCLLSGASVAAAATKSSQNILLLSSFTPTQFHNTCFAKKEIRATFIAIKIVHSQKFVKKYPVPIIFRCLHKKDQVMYHKFVPKMGQPIGNFIPKIRLPFSNYILKIRVPVCNFMPKIRICIEMLSFFQLFTSVKSVSEWSFT